MSRNIGLLIAALAMLICLGSGCTPTWYANWADRDAYGAISEGQSSALGKGYRFDIAYNPVDCDQYLKKAKDEADSEIDVLPIADALKVAFKNSRAFQTRKEALYAAALSLANLSRGWETVLPAGEINSTGEMIRTNKGAPEGGTDSTNRYINGDGNYSLTRRLVGGGLLTLGASMNFATNFLGLSDSQAGSLIEGGFTQPLLRGAWRGLAFEDQHRRERNFLIDIYEFDRFRQTFAVDIMDKYYAILTLKDQLENSRTNIKRLRTAYLVTQAMVKGGQLTRAQEDQAEQDLLNAQIGMERRILAYSNALDNFKITLGLPISKDLRLDFPGALIRLNEAGPQTLPFAETLATSTSMVTDTALLRARSGARDADKDVEIAADNFNPNLDLELKASAPGTDKAQPGRIQTHHHTRSAKFVFNYNLDQTDNRDAYRNAIIAKGQSARGLAQAEDTATLNVRNSFRSLTQSRRSFKLQAKSVEIAKRRTVLIAIQRKQGQATTRDVLEAEDALNNALNGLTSSLVNYTMTRLHFLASLGMLSVDAGGKLSERKTPFGYDRLQKRYGYLKSGGDKKDKPSAAKSKKAEEAKPDGEKEAAKEKTDEK
ncbi:MAG: TolC family protein [Phycisphaerae bacterium]|jgi:outer membrane protein TolC|nr:TolC family protein [Phycisphaerae bacterium]